MTISEISQATGLSADTLRYYEKIELIKDVNRSSGGKRDYSQADLDHLNFINCMKKAGCTLEVIKQYIILYQAGNETISERVELLEEQKKALVAAMTELQESIDYIDYKIEATQKRK